MEEEIFCSYTIRFPARNLIVVLVEYLLVLLKLLDSTLVATKSTSDSSHSISSSPN